MKKRLLCLLQGRNYQKDIEIIAYRVIMPAAKNGYVLATKTDSSLKPQEVLTACKILLESRALVKEEMFPILRKLVNLCSTDSEKKLVSEYIGNEMHHYIELRHGKRILDTLWTLECAVNEQRYVKIRYQKLKNREMVTRVVKPVGVMFSEFYFYLTAFIEDIDKEKVFQNPDAPFPTIYRLDRHDLRNGTADWSEDDTGGGRRRGIECGDNF